jgi:hypothetical protein
LLRFQNYTLFGIASNGHDSSPQECIFHGTTWVRESLEAC